MTIQKEQIASCLLAAAMLLTSLCAWPELVPGTMDVHWNEGAPNCASNPQKPLQVHRYNSQTFILRENPCATFEAPFMYLLVGSSRAVLIDTGDVEDANQMPLAKTVMGLLPGDGAAELPLLVVHTHRHSDHRAGDTQFAHLPTVEVVGFDLDSVRRYYKFTNWPEGMVQIDLGDRTVDVLPTPGHNETEVSFYDRNTGLFLSGDFLLPGRLMIDDTPAEIASADRVAAFVKDRPITFVLGGHIEKDAAGETFSWESQYHPGEASLQLTKDDLLALPGVVRGFNGFYDTDGKFILMNTIRLLIAEAILAAGILAAIVWALVRYLRHRRARRVRSQVPA